MAYLDTSVLIACYVPEALSVKAQREAQRARTPVISNLSILEFASALSTKTRTGHLSHSDAHQVDTTFQAHLNAGHFKLATLSAQEFQTARNWVIGFSSPLRTLDALHLALAHSHQETLVTADQGLANSAKVLGVKFRFLS